MKKIFILLVVATVSMLFFGCEKKTESLKTCKLISGGNTSSYTNESEYKIYSDGDVVKKVVISMVTVTDNENLLDQTEKFTNDTYSPLKDKYVGYDYSIKRKKNKVTSNITIDYEKINMDDYLNDNESMKSYVNNKNQFLTSEFIKLYEKLGAICE